TASTPFRRSAIESIRTRPFSLLRFDPSLHFRLLSSVSHASPPPKPAPPPRRSPRKSGRRRRSGADLGEVCGGGDGARPSTTGRSSPPRPTHVHPHPGPPPSPVDHRRLTRLEATPPRPVKPTRVGIAGSFTTLSRTPSSTRRPQSPPLPSPSTPKARRSQVQCSRRPSRDSRGWTWCRSISLRRCLLQAQPQPHPHP
ncbi:unnamed protein product, partial [Urochloa humidicola]